MLPHSSLLLYCCCQTHKHTARHDLDPLLCSLTSTLYVTACPSCADPHMIANGLLTHNLEISDKPECKKCQKALQELENIDDEADQLGIGFVKIHDEDLADEYNLGALPKLVYYRHQIPIIYESKSNHLKVKDHLIEMLELFFL